MIFLQNIDWSFIKTAANTVGQYVLYPAVAGLLFAISNYIQNWLKARRSHQLEFHFKQNVDLQTLLIELRVETSADRCYISMFHNGDRFIDGSSMIKSSRVCEVCAPGISHESEKWQAILVSSVPEVIKLILKDDVNILKTDDLPNCKFRSMMVSGGVQYVIFVNIKKGQDITGVLALNYVGSDSSPTDIDVVKIQLKRYGQRISGLLYS